MSEPPESEEAPEIEAPPQPPTAVRFHCEMVRAEGLLQIRYTVVNDGPEEVAVLDALRTNAIDGAREYLRDTVFAEIEGDRLHLIKGALPIPNGVFPSIDESPMAHGVAKGEELTETFSVPVPVLARQPFKRSSLKGDVTPSLAATVRTVIVSIGVVPIGRGCRLFSERPAYPELKTLFPPNLHRIGQTLLTQSFTLSEPLAVLDYQAFPWKN